MAAQPQATIENIVAALQVFSGAPSKDALDAANAWLQEFQHSVCVSPASILRLLILLLTRFTL